nr:MAG: hypothetical protein [Bacteriophage sp.]
MKAIGIKMVDLQPMTAKEAFDKGYGMKSNQYPEGNGYEVTYPDGYKSWSPKEVADAAYFPIDDENGQMIKPTDIERFIAAEDAEKLGTKTTIVSIRTLTGFESHGLSSCVDPSRYDINIGKKFAKEKAVDAIWAGLGFVLQWAKFGLKQKPVTSKYPAHVERMIAELKELADRTTKLAKFISENEMFKTLSEHEQKDMRDQLLHMNEYLGFLSSRLSRAGVDINNI